MAGNPNMIGGGRLTRAEVSGDRRRLEGLHMSKGKLLLRLWRYLGRNQGLIVLALCLSLTSSMLALYGPKLSGKAINAIDLGAHQYHKPIDQDIQYACQAISHTGQDRQNRTIPAIFQICPFWPAIYIYRCAVSFFFHQHASDDQEIHSNTNQK